MKISREVLQEINITLALLRVAIDLNDAAKNQTILLAMDHLEALRVLAAQQKKSTRRDVVTSNQTP